MLPGAPLEVKSRLEVLSLDTYTMALGLDGEESGPAAPHSGPGELPGMSCDELCADIDGHTSAIGAIEDIWNALAIREDIAGDHPVFEFLSGLYSEQSNLLTEACQSCREKRCDCRCSQKTAGMNCEGAMVGMHDCAQV